MTIYMYNPILLFDDFARARSHGVKSMVCCDARQLLRGSTRLQAERYADLLSGGEEVRLQRSSGVFKIPEQQDISCR